MSQCVLFQLDGQIVQRELPDPDVRVWNEITWGEHYCLFTPAYWVSHVWTNQLDTTATSPYFSQSSLAEEVSFCMLSGFGITAELAGAAFDSCRLHGLIEKYCDDENAWAAVLKSPLNQNGKQVHYRYPNQKAKFLADAMRVLKEGRIDLSNGVALRDSLLQIKGCGLKTAGFIARNFLDSDEVAILDIHVIRACQLMNLFSDKDKVEKDYKGMEQRYIEFCKAIKIRPSVLDCVIWSQMRILGSCALDAIKYKFGQQSTPKPTPPRLRQLSLAI